MSIRLMDRVWRESKYEGGALIVLLALADFSNDEGECFPSISAIAHKARLTERQVYTILHRFEEDGILSLTARGGGRQSNRYRLNLTAVTPEKNSPLKELHPLKPTSGHPCTPLQGTPEICDSAIRKNRHLTVSEPSEERRAKRATQFPEGFRPKESHGRLATELGVSLKTSFPVFTDYHLSKGSLFKNWDRALNTWLRNEQKFGANGKHKAGDHDEREKIRRAAERHSRPADKRDSDRVSPDMER